MTQRERFLRCMAFQSVDRIPLMDMGLWPETLERWHDEGLPAEVNSLRALERHLELDVSFNMNWLPIEFDVYPAFEEEILEETDEDRVIRDTRGITLRERKRYKSIPQYIRFAFENEAEYERLLPRLDGADPGRYAADFDEDLNGRVQRGEIVGINFRSFFGFPRNYMGVENWCVAFYDNPAFVRRVIADRLQSAKASLQRVLATGRLDFVQVWEDMSYKTAPLISPAFVREFMQPAYEELVAFLRAGGVPLIMVDTDGHAEDLLPIFLEAGMDGMHPCEMAAGTDPVAIRKAYPRSALMGGMDKRILAQGREGVDAEIARIKPILSQGGFIPMLDHFIPPDISYDTYRYYVDRRREVLAC